MKMKNKTFKELLCELEGKEFLIFAVDRTFNVSGEFEVLNDGILFNNKFILFNKVIGIQIIDYL